jgi:hypothetical protein
MNQQIENLVVKEKERIIASEKEKRDKHLISIGLIDEGKTIRQYQDYYSNNSKYDEDKKQYYIEIAGALDVTDEEYLEICKYFPTVDKEVKVSFERSGVRTLNGFGTFFFIIASIAALVTIIGFIMYIANDMDYRFERDNAMLGLSLASSFLPIAIGSFAGGAICRGLSSISKTALYTRTLLEKQYQFVE